METEEIEHLLATRLDRFGGAFLDAFTIALLMMPILWSLGIFQKEISEEPLELWMEVFEITIGWVLFFALNTYLLVKRGQTIGKTIVKTKIINKEEDIPGATSLIGKRYLIPGIISYIPVVGQIFALIDALFIFRKDKRCLHDLIADTYVIKIG